MVRFVLMVATAAFTSLGTTSPRYMRQHAMYLPWRGSHLVIIEAGSKVALVISATDSCSWYAFSAEMIGAYEGAVEAERRRERGDALGDQPVEVGVGRALDVEVAAADIVNRLIVKGSVHVHVLEQGVA
eukprot:905370-Rhodomonas_salina.2